VIVTLSSELVQRVTRAVGERLPGAPAQVVEAVVVEVLGAMGPAPASAPGPATSSGAGFSVDQLASAAALDVDHCALCRAHEARSRSRAVCTTTGRNRPGIVATVARVIAESGGDIVDISQTLVSDYFTMIIVVDVGSLAVPFGEFQQALNTTIRDLGCQAMIMHEDVLTALHRV
jgi:ACT domain-containing protein